VSAQCTRGKRYDSLEAARAGAKLHRRTYTPNPYRRTAAPRPWHCAECNGWHVGQAGGDRPEWATRGFDRMYRREGDE